MELAHDYLELATPAGETIKVLRKSHPRARRLRLTVTPGGARVTYPEGTHPAQVFAFLRKHGEWLERKLDELSLGSAPPPLKPGAATVMPLRGETTRLSWRDGAWPQIEQLDDRLVLTLPRPHGKSTLPAARSAFSCAGSALASTFNPTASAVSGSTADSTTSCMRN